MRRLVDFPFVRRGDQQQRARRQRARDLRQGARRFAQMFDRDDVDGGIECAACERAAR